MLLAIEIVCLVVVAICAVILVREIGSYVADDNDFKAVTESTGRDISALRAQNADCIGWVSVDDTRIDYPVMYTRSSTRTTCATAACSASSRSSATRNS